MPAHPKASVLNKGTDARSLHSANSDRCAFEQDSSDSIESCSSSSSSRSISRALALTASVPYATMSVVAVLACCEFEIGIMRQAVKKRAAFGREEATKCRLHSH